MTTKRDSDGRLLRTGRTYKLHAAACRHRFPSHSSCGLTLYSENTRCPYDNGGADARSVNLDSRDENLPRHGDGSVDLYIGPTVPAGMKGT
jgi:hypothetical protein